MSFDKTFCASPWFHMRINNQGHYEYCRWASADTLLPGPSIKDLDPAEYFQQHMTEIRNNLLSENVVPGCQQCHLMEKHNKISGRQRQLLKVGVTTNNFDKTVASSPWFDQLRYSDIDLLPQDWQIDLGNFCNSACVFCTPNYSSRLASEFKKLKIVHQSPPSNWCDDPAQLEKFLSILKRSPTVKYLHFIGGETLITPAFKTILQALIDSDLHRTVSIGFTTNLITWDDAVCDMLTQFHDVHLGLSVECFDALNDYVRWPSKIDTVQQLTKTWISLAHQHQWSVQFRITPTMLTMGRLLSVYDYAWDNNITIESCNFLENPKCLKISVLPIELRKKYLEHMQHWLDAHDCESDQILNIRNPEHARTQIVQDLKSYVNYLQNEIDESHLLTDAVTYLKLLESNRKNSVLDYLPEYEQLFRSAGY